MEAETQGRKETMSRGDEKDRDERPFDAHGWLFGEPPVSTVAIDVPPRQGPRRVQSEKDTRTRVDHVEFQILNKRTPKHVESYPQQRLWGRHGRLLTALRRKRSMRGHRHEKTMVPKRKGDEIERH